MVEGPDDLALFRHLCRGRDVEVDAYTGDNLRSEIRTLSDLVGFADVRRVVVIHDADRDRQASLMKVWTHLLNAWDRDVPQEGDVVSWDRKNVLRTLPEDQWVTGPEGREWKVWLVPGGNTGDLEELLWRAATDQQARDCVEAMLDCLGAEAEFKTRSKARLMAYLAVREEPVPSIHRLVEQSARRSGIDLAHPALEWLRQRIAAL